MAEERFDVTARKFHQWVVITLSILAYLLYDAAGGVLMVAVGLVMVIGRYRDGADLFRLFYQAMLVPRRVLEPRMVVEDRATRRIARVLGGSIQILAGLLVLAGQAVGVAWGLVALIAVMIALDAIFDFCVLCFVVHRARLATSS